MKKHVVLLLVFSYILMMASCTKEKTNYYVKYDVASTGTNHIGTMTLNLNTERGMQTISTSSKVFSETFGPVSKGFEATVSAAASYPTYLNTSIYVCKGQEPFVLKATGTSSAQYVIDF